MVSNADCRASERKGIDPLACDSHVQAACDGRGMHVSEWWVHVTDWWVHVSECGRM